MVNPQTNHLDRRSFIEFSLATFVLSSTGIFRQEPELEKGHKFQDSINKSAIELVTASCVKLEKEYGVGSGVVIFDSLARKYYLVTARHVLTDRCISLGNLIHNNEILKSGGELEAINDSAKVLFNPASEYALNSYIAKPIEVPGVELAKLMPEWGHSLCATRDLALLEIIDFKPQLNTPVFRDLITHPLKPGEPVFIIGNSEDFTLKYGKVLEPKHIDTQVDLCQEFVLINMAVAEGDSGAALFDAQGQIVGMIRKRSVVKEDMAYVLPATDIIEKLTKSWGLSIN